MNTTKFKTDYYLQRVYGRISETEIYCRLIVMSKLNNYEITGLETKINTYDIGQVLNDSKFTMQPISWGKYLNQTIVMLFNLLMIRLDISDIHSVEGMDNISTFFDENPFHPEK